AGAGLDPDEVEGCPPPRSDALERSAERLSAERRTTPLADALGGASVGSTLLLAADRDDRPTTTDHRPTTGEGRRTKDEGSVSSFIVHRSSFRSPCHLVTRPSTPIDRLWLVDTGVAQWEAAAACIDQLAAHVDVVARWDDADRLAALLAEAIGAN